MDKSKNDTSEAIRYRFYVPQLCAGNCSFSGPEAHHALHVLRVRVGTKVELFDGKGSYASAEVTRTSRSEVFVTAADPQSQPPVSPRVHLCFAVPKGKRLDWLLEKTTELAATSLQPVVFNRSVAGGELTLSKLQRWEAQCISAAKQSGVNYLPEIRPLVTLQEFLSAPPATGHLRLFGDLDDSTPPLSIILREKKSDDITLLIGPEGGFASDERSSMLVRGGVPARLGKTTLRIETAAVALLSVIRGQE
ncbi:MAG: 16S rRNA (uracil(1498)-N(3))-methyltransferase [Phycisphaerae bacterium]|nr:16S rRNA (uracil(1498)-N(3))-methyltransferase [Phycisphaerae bacterium]